MTMLEMCEALVAKCEALQAHAKDLIQLSNAMRAETASPFELRNEEPS